MAEWLRALIVHYRSLPFDYLTAVSGVGSSPTWGTCETSQVLLVAVSGGFSHRRFFSGFSRFRPT